MSGFLSKLHNFSRQPNKDSELIRSVLIDQSSSQEARMKAISDLHALYKNNIGNLSTFDAFLEGYQLSPHVKERIRSDISMYMLYDSGEIPPESSDTLPGFRNITLSEIEDASKGLFDTQTAEKIFIALSKYKFHVDSLFRLKKTMAQSQDYHLVADLYHTTTGRSLEGIIEQNGALYDGFSLFKKGIKPLSGEGIKKLDKDGKPIFSNPGQISFASFVTRTYVDIEWFRDVDQLISFGVNDVQTRKSLTTADGSRGVQRPVPYSLYSNLHSVICDIVLIDKSKEFLKSLNLEHIPVISIQELLILNILTQTLRYYLDQTSEDKFINALLSQK